MLVDNELTWQQEKTGFKRVLAPPTPEKLKVIHDLVAGITGLNAERGDQLVVESLPFENTLTIEPPEAAKPIAPAKPQGPMKWPPDRNTLLIGAGAAVLLIGAGFLAAMMLRSGKRKATASTEKALPSGDAGHAGADGDSGVSIEKQLEIKTGRAGCDAGATGGAGAQESANRSGDHERRRKSSRNTCARRSNMSRRFQAQVLRTWINEGEN